MGRGRYQYTCSITSIEETVNFISGIDLFPYFSREEFLREHLDLRVSRNCMETPFMIQYKNAAFESLKYSKRKGYLTYPWDKMDNGHMLVYASYPFVELQRQINSCVTAHAATVALDGKAVLLLGKVGAGKTSISIDLCRRYKAAIVGNDIVVIGLKNGELCVKGGTKFFFLRYESVKRNLPDLLHFFPKNPEDTWLCKIKIKPEDIGVAVQQEKVMVEKVYMVHIDGSSSSLFVKNDDTLVTKLFLNENFSRYIRGTCLSVFGGVNLDILGFVPSYDRAELFEFRKKLISVIMGSIRYISGPLEAVTDYIAQNI